MKKSKVRFGRKFHKIAIRYTVLPGLGLAAFLCAGCGIPASGIRNPDTESTAGGKISCMESTPVVDYVVPQLVPNILVDTAGYRTTGAKRAVVKGKQLPDGFDLVDAETGEVVFSGPLENVEYSKEQELYSGYADFGSFCKEGEYYLECDHAGRSYSFLLEEDHYEHLFDELCSGVIEDCKAKKIDYEDANRILQAYEWYGDVFTDQDGDQIPDVLKALADWFRDTKDETIPEGQEAEYSAILAKFSFLYQKYDRQFATECMKHALVIFDQNQGKMQKDAACFQALTEIYRATGLYTYKNQIEEYETYFESHRNLAEKSGYLYGAMTYINTRQAVDVDLCKLFMDALMEQGESISILYGEMIHPVAAHNDGEEDLLAHASELACANYIMNNYQYSRILEEFLHYLRGRNAQSVDFYNISSDKKAEYLLLFSQLVSVQENLDE